MKMMALLIALLFPLTSMAQAGDFVPGEIIVKFKSPQSDFRSLGKAAANAQIRHQKAWRSGNFHQFSMKTSDSVQDVLQRLKEDPEVEYAEPNYYLYSTQQSYSATSAAIGVVESWSIQSPNGDHLEPPIIAILDSGIDVNHRVFRNTGRLWTNPNERDGNGYDDDRNGYKDDRHGWNFINNNPDVSDPANGTGHGTHVAGIAVGVSEEINNFKPQNAPPPKVQIMPLKFLDGKGVGKTSDAIEAIYYAVDNGARVINNSWGGRNYSAALHEALTYAYNKGVVIVSAAGNNGTDNDLRPMYPASYDIPSMISVAAADNWDVLADFSNYGAESVHVAAPGVGIYSTVPSGSGREYSYKSGTSMAAPFIAGLAAMLIREAPDLTGYQIKQKILETSPSVVRCAAEHPVQFCVEDDRRMDARQAMVYVKTSHKEAPYQPAYNPTFQVSSRGLASTDLVAQGFGCGTVKTLYTDANKNLGQKNNPRTPPPATLVLLMVPVLVALGFKYKYRQHDRRSNERQRIFMPGQIVTDRGFVVPVHVLCWSAGGAGIQVDSGDQDVLKGVDPASITLRIKSKLGSVIVSSAKVVRKDENGYLGVQFSSTATLEQKQKN